MICRYCRAAGDLKGRPDTEQIRKDLHAKCRGGNHCVCQHRLVNSEKR